MAYDTQNTLGRLCDEEIYKNDLAARIQGANLGLVHRELSLTVTHRTFTKPYFLDLVVAGFAVYELKTANRIISAHEAQLLNYLLLWGAEHGKILNFRPGQVETRFVNAPLALDRRRQDSVNIERWDQNDPIAENLKNTFLELVADWGAFLDLSLYLEALTFLLGGEDLIVKPVPFARDGFGLGSQRLRLASPDSAFRLTGLADPSSYEHQLSSLLRHTPLRTFHWINLHQHEIRFITLRKP